MSNTCDHINFQKNYKFMASQFRSIPLVVVFFRVAETVRPIHRFPLARRFLPKPSGPYLIHRSDDVLRDRRQPRAPVRTVPGLRPAAWQPAPPPGSDAPGGLGSLREDSISFHRRRRASTRPPATGAEVGEAIHRGAVNVPERIWWDGKAKFAWTFKDSCGRGDRTS